MATDRKILWMGPDSPVSRSESRRLASLGFEVQIDLRPEGVAMWDLPSVGRDRLSAFQGVIVAEDLTLLNDVLRNFDGRLVFRSYGTASPVGSALFEMSAHGLAGARMGLNFAFSAPDLLMRESAHVSAHGRSVPFTLPEESCGPEDSWVGPEDAADGQILTVLDPRDAHPAARRVMLLARDCFAGPEFFNIDTSTGPSVGVLHGADTSALRAFQGCRGFLDLSPTPAVLRLPVLEAMQIGAPIVYFSGSALSARLGSGGPGEAGNIEEARRLCSRLSQGDAALAASMKAAQAPFRQTLAPWQVWPAFDQAFEEMLCGLAARVDHRHTIVIGDDPRAAEVRQAARMAAHLLTAAKMPEAAADIVFARRVVRLFYEGLLMREPEPEGLKNHVETIVRERSLDHVVRGIALSEEYRSKVARNPFVAWLEESPSAAS